MEDEALECGGRSQAECLANAEQYCRERAAMAWSEAEKDRWHRLAEMNRGHRERLEGENA